jgi:ABC-type nickel/cobalt efflux system permease component RcnA
VIGFSWGLGHTLGMLLIGLLFILFKELLPVDLISRQSDKVIGILLIVIGGWAIIRIYLKHSHGNRAHIHFHTKPFLYAHIHRHSHDKSPSHEHEHTGPIKQTALTALFIGVIHGFAGFNHLFVLLPSLALPTVWDSVIYITAFASGTILTMILFAFILGLVAFRSAVKDKQLFLKWFTFSGGLLAIAIGVLWLIHPI